MLKKQELCKDYMQGLEPCCKLCDAPFLAMRERESRHFNDESTSIHITTLTIMDGILMELLLNGIIQLWMKAMIL